MVLAAFILCNITASAQFDWLVKPIIEYDDFYYHPEYTSAVIIIQEGKDNYGVMRRNGEVLYPVGAFTRVSAIAGSDLLQGFTHDGATVLFNQTGKVISEPYDQVNCYWHTNIVMAKKNDLFGLIDTSGNVIVEPQYRDLRRTRQGLYVGTLPDGTSENVTVDESDGMYPALRVKNFRINSSKIKDRVVIRAKSQKRGYDYYGFTDMDGDTILTPDRYYSNYLKMKYDAQVMIAIDSETDLEGVLDKNGNVLVPFEYDYFWTGMAEKKYFVAKKDSTYFLVDKNARETASLVADQAFPLDDWPYMKARHGKGWMIYNTSFEPVLRDTFSYVSDARGKNFIILKKHKKTGFFVLESGRYIEPEYTKLAMPASDTMGVRHEKGYGVFDIINDQFLTDPIYTTMSANGRYLIGSIITKDSVEQDGKMVLETLKDSYLMNKSGEIVYGPTSSVIPRIGRDLFMVQTPDDSAMVFNAVTGDSLILASGDVRFLGGNIFKTNDDKYFLAEDFLKDDRVLYDYLGKVEEKVRVFKLGELYGLMHDGEIAVPAEFEEVKDIRNGMIKVKKEGKWGVLNNPYVQRDM